MQRPSWHSIYSYYLTHEDSTLKECAHIFGVSYLSLRQKASDEQWTEKKKQLYETARNDIEMRTYDEIKKRQEEQVKQAQLLQQEGITAIHEYGARPQTFEEARLAILTGIRLEREALQMDEKNMSFIRISGK